MIEDNENCSDLVILTADIDAEKTIETLLTERLHSINIAEDIRYQIYRHPNRDNGCYNKAHKFLRPFNTEFKHALVIFDKDGSGAEGKSRCDIQKEVEKNLKINGWESSACVVIDPELEVWVWSDSPEVDNCLGWSELRNLRNELKNIWPTKDPKPDDPKKALKRILKITNKPHSPAIFKNLAKEVSLKRCEDPSFNRFKTILQEWFS